MTASLIDAQIIRIFHITWILFSSFAVIQLQQIQPFAQSPFLDNNRLSRVTPLWVPQELLSNIYNNQQAPSMNNTPVMVDLSLELLSIRPVEEDLSSQKLDLIMTQVWDDFRLQTPRALSASKRIVLDRRWKDILWVPNLYLKNSLRSEMPSTVDSNMYMSISNRTRVHLTARFTVHLMCDSDISRYPFDGQQCNLEITLSTAKEESIKRSETLDTVGLRWNEFKVSASASSHEFKMINSDFGACVSTKGSEAFSCLKATFSLVRRSSDHFFARFLPSCLFVFVAFGSFWIPANSYGARTSLILAPQLSTVILQNLNAPNLATLHAYNLWFLMCNFFIAACFLEYVITINENLSSKSDEISRFLMDTKLLQSPAMYKFKNLLRPSDANNIFDILSRFAFPSLFLCLVFLYLMCFAF